MKAFKKRRKTKPEELDQLESFLGCKLSSSVKDFLQNYCGSEADYPYEFPVEDDVKTSIWYFFTVDEIREQHSFRDGFPRDLIPISVDGFGNLVILDPRNDAVYFKDFLNDTETKLVESPFKFLEILSKEKSEDFTKDMEGSSGEIDADFLEELKELEAKTGKKILL